MFECYFIIWQPPTLSATHVAIFKVVRTRSQLQFYCVRNNPQL